ncbi:hypothetical protein K466DRAFT_605899 [Polyporus arcularius HHB13444]|uniref:Uncharacterized protein n=1 Tax=Polyporus arcularius HHB13444 TaxID=1314778 RepID=A0A5C3P1Y9_9APHY|nr:hypothetical protein K466DRAFT_605899 [Polyporus arcularius HHB13444]
MSQVPLIAEYATDISSIPDSIWQDSLIYPAYAAGISLLVLISSAFCDRFLTPKSSALCASETLAIPATSSSLRRRIESIGGLDIFVYRVVQLLGILFLLGISIAQFVSDDSPTALTASRTLQAVQIAIYVGSCI